MLVPTLFYFRFLSCIFSIAFSKSPSSIIYCLAFLNSSYSRPAFSFPISNILYPFFQFFEIIERQVGIFQAFIIQDKSLDNVFP